jgi:hypothetical protein
MDEKAPITPTILAHRSRTEARLRDLLDESESGLTLEAVKTLIFEAEATDFPRFVLAMSEAFNCENLDDLDDVALQVIQDAWNYFPHGELEGRSPAELMAQST